MEFYHAFWYGIVKGLSFLLPLGDSLHFETLKIVMSRYDDVFEFLWAGSSLAVLLAILLYFRKDIIAVFAHKKFEKIAKLMLMGLPLVILSIFLKDKIRYNEILSMMKISGACLIASGIAILQVEKKFKKTKLTKIEELSFARVLVIGLLGCLAIFNGFSIVPILYIANRVAGFAAPRAAKNAIFASIPVLIFESVSAFTKYDFVPLLNDNFGYIIISALMVFLLSLVSLYFITKVSEKRKDLNCYAWYEISFALFVLFFEFIK